MTCMLYLLLLPLLSVSLYASPKLVTTGFTCPNVGELRKYLPEFEKHQPGNGTVIFLDKPAPGGRHPWAYRHSVFHRNWRWKSEWFKDTLEDLKYIRANARKLTDNFFYVASTGHDYDIFNDQAWDCLYNNIGIMADLACRGGLKGLFFDIEFYNKDGIPGMFHYVPSCGRSFQECSAKARERGRKFMQTITAAFPDIVIICPLGFSINFQALNCRNPEDALVSERYGLSPAFYNGMLDVIPPRAKMLDGMELAGYIAGTAEDYYRLIRDYYKFTPRLCAPENLAKIYAQSGPAIPIYLNVYKTEGGFWCVKNDTMDRMRLFRRNLYHAMQNTTDYVWMYHDTVGNIGAKFAPVPHGKFYEGVLKKLGKGKAALWSELLPGFDDAVAAAVDPEGFALQKIASGKAVRVFADDFENGKSSLSHWISRQKGTIGVVDGGLKSGKALRFKEVVFGSAFRRLPVKPGEFYLLRAAAHTGGPAAARLAAQWSLKGQNTRHMECPEVPFTRKLENGWQEAVLPVFVPDGVDRLHASLSVKTEERSSSSVIDFDRLEVFRID